jgi:hypothetical protein
MLLAQDTNSSARKALRKYSVLTAHPAPYSSEYTEGKSLKGREMFFH